MKRCLAMVAQSQGPERDLRVERRYGVDHLAAVTRPGVADDPILGELVRASSVGVDDPEVVPTAAGTGVDEQELLRVRRQRGRRRRRVLDAGGDVKPQVTDRSL